MDIATLLAVVGGVLVALGVLGLVRTSAWVLTPLFLGVLFGLALDSVVGAIQRRLRCSRAVATVAIGALLAVLLAGIVVLLGPQAVEQAGSFADDLPATIEEFYSWPIVGDRLEQWDAIGRVEAFVDDLPSRFDTEAISSLGGQILNVAGAALLVLVTTVAVLLDGPALVERGRRLVPADRRARSDEIGRIVYRSIASYFAGSLTVALLNGTVILTAGLILGVPLALLAGIWASITNLIPQIGGFLGGSFFVVLAFSQGAVTGAIALALFLGYQQLENHVIQPTVIGRAVHLTPPTTMLAALIGGAAAGVPGALVATPLVGAAKSVWLDVVEPSNDRPT